MTMGVIRVLWIVLWSSLWFTGWLAGQEIQLSQVRAFGVLDGEPALTFGSIQDIAVDERGLVYVLDELTFEIRVFDQDGRHLQTVGRQGHGPGEYEVPSSLAISSQSELYVADRAHRHITIYGMRDSLELSRDLRVEFGIRDMCFVGNRLFALGSHNAQVVHELTLDSSEVLARHSFAEPVSEHPTRRHRVDHLLCLPASDMLVIGSRDSPLVRAYSSGGDSLWSTMLPDYYGLVITERADGRTEYLFPEGRDWYHWVLSIVALSPSGIAVQLGRVGYGVRPEETTDIELRLMSMDGSR
jgi:hypothetical protein